MKAILRCFFSGLLVYLILIPQLTAQTWRLLGPHNTPLPLQDSGKFSPHGIGRLHAILLLNKKGSKIIVSSSTGGAFFTNNRGKNWKPAPEYDYLSGANALTKMGKKKLWLATCSNHLPAEHWGVGVLEWDMKKNLMYPTGFHVLPSEYDKCCLYDMKENPKNPKEIWIISDTKVWKTSDKGKSWNLLFEEPLGFFRNLMVNVRNPNEWWIMGAKVIHTIDGGKTFVDRTAALQSPLLQFGIDRVRMCYFGKDGHTLFALVMAKFVNLLRSDDGGITWKSEQVLSGHFGLHPFGIHQFEHNHRSYLLLEGIRAYLSADTGKTIQQITYPILGPNYVHDDIRASAFTKKGHLYLAHDGGLSLSKDLGKSWESLNGTGLSITQCYGMSNSEIAPDLLFAGTLDMSSLIYKDGQWYCTSTLYADGGRARIHPTDTSYVLISASGFLYQQDSTNKQNWRYDHPITKRGDFDFAMHFSPSGDRFLMATNYLFSRNTGSQKWNNLTQSLPSSSKEITSFALSPTKENEIWFARTEPTWNPNDLSQKLYFSNDFGFSWKDMTPSLPILAWRFIRNLCIDPFDDNTIYAGLGNFDNPENNASTLHKVYLTKDKGKTWENQSRGLPNFPVNYLCTNATHLFAATDVGVYFCSKSDYTWQKLGTGLPPVVAKEIHINNKLNTLRVATFGRGIWEVSLDTLNKQAGR